MKPIRKIAICTLFAAALAAPLTAAAQEAPEASIERAVNAVLAELSVRRDELQGDTAALLELMEREVVPLFDLPSISRLALGKYWKKANPQQRLDFAAEFKKLMLGTYAEALFQYTGDQSITFGGTEFTERKGRQTAKVSSEVDLGDGSEPVPVEYTMLLSKKDNRWKIINIKVAGFDMVNSYRTTYGALVSSQGMDGVIASMREANAENF